MTEPATNKPTDKYRVWHIPQVPMQPFHVQVATYPEAVNIQDVLADYDIFQFENNIKPDYSNASGIEYLEDDGEWTEVESDDDEH